MFLPGLTSISFRNLNVDNVIHLMNKSNINYIEWGGDIHVPTDDIDNAVEVRKKCNENDIICTSYGSYFRIGKDDPADFPSILAVCKALKAKCVRIWCGTKNFEEYSKYERRQLINDAKLISYIAEANLIPVCMECHGKTYTNSIQGALDLMENVNSPYFKMYWQPNQFVSIAENLDYAKKIKKYVSNIHVFNWKGNDKFSLDLAIDEWIEYLRIFNDDEERALLLEFMPDDSPNSLDKEFKTLINIINKL